jgi:transcriptional regulator GlxA family with amidase domain
MGKAMIDVTVLLLDDGLPSTALAPLEILACAGTLWGALTGTPSEPRFRVRTATVARRKTNHFVPISLQPGRALSDVRRTDLIIVPAIGADLEDGLARNRTVIEWIARRSRHAAVASICTGAILLAEAGLLDGRPATTHWAVVDWARARYPRVKWQPERFVTEAGNVFCGGGVYSSIDLSLYLVEHYCGHEVAVRTAKALLLQTPRIWQTPYAAEPPRFAHDDEAVKRAQSFLFTHFREAVDVDQLAGKVGMSPRNFARRFKAATGEAPLAYLHRLRIDGAKHLLESAHRSVQEISAEVGYGDVAFFRTLFRRYTGTSPREYRARFGPTREPARAAKTPGRGSDETAVASKVRNMTGKLPRIVA